MAPFRLAHVSDVHLGPIPRPEWRDLANKRLTGYLTYQGHRARRYDLAYLAATLHDIEAHAPDHVALTGDVVNIGLEIEFKRAAAFLESVGPPERMTVVPGNHDAYLAASVPFMQTAFSPWMTGDAPTDGEPELSSAGADGFPFLRRRGPVALIGLSSAVPTLPFIATGTLGAAQLDRLSALLDRLGREGAFRVVMIHHPPYRGGTKPLRGLTDAAAFEAAIAAFGAELVLHGHNHRLQVHELPGPAGRRVPVVGVAAASASSQAEGYRAGWNLIEIENGRASLTRRVCRPGPAGAGFETAARLTLTGLGPALAV